MIKVAEQALLFVKSALGGQGEDSPSTVLEDGLLRQSIDVSRIASSGFTVGDGHGLFTGLQRQIHAAAGDLVEIIDPYAPGTVIPPYPFVPTQDFDLWFLGVGVVVASTSQTIDMVQFGRRPKSVEGWSDGTIARNEQILAFWDTPIADAGMGIIMSNAANGLSYQAPPFPIRFSRNDELIVASQVTGAGATELDFNSWWFLGRRALVPSAF